MPVADGVEQRLVPDRLGQEIDGAGLHRLHCHRDVAVTGEEDNRLRVVCRGEMLLEIETARPRHADIEHQAARPIGEFRLEHLTRRAEAGRVDPHRKQELLDRRADGRIIVDDQHQRAVRLGSLVHRVTFWLLRLETVDHFIGRDGAKFRRRLARTSPIRGARVEPNDPAAEPMRVNRIGARAQQDERSEAAGGRHKKQGRLSPGSEQGDDRRQRKQQRHRPGAATRHESQRQTAGRNGHQPPTARPQAADYGKCNHRTGEPHQQQADAGDSVGI